jgi:hypothetical protein
MKKEVKGNIWDAKSDDKNELIEEGGTDGDTNKNDKSQVDNGVCVCQPLVTRGVAVTPAIPIANDSPDDIPSIPWGS